MILLAMDRAPSVRRYDKNGRLHVEISNISKANVCPYFGKEIPKWQELGLEPDRIYNLLRDPEELKKGAHTFNNLPILSEHVPVHAFDDESHGADLVVGSTGTDAVFDGTYVANSLVVWAKPSIDMIEEDVKRELSSSYWFTADMTPGKFGGVDYDGVMRDIVGNHVALVFDGRAGSDVIVGDEKPMALKTRRALMLAGAVTGYFRPLLAQDAKLDLGTTLEGVSNKSLAKPGATRKLAETIFGLAQPHLANDAGLDVEDVCKVIDAVQGTPLDGADELAVVAEDEDPEDEARKRLNVAEDEDPDDDDDKPAMDSATVQRMIDRARREGRSQAASDNAAIRSAEREVMPFVGELPVMDSAADVYKAGLEALGADLTGLDPKSYGATFRIAAKARGEAVPVLAHDAAPSAANVTDFDKRYPNRVKLIRG